MLVLTPVWQAKIRFKVAHAEEKAEKAKAKMLVQEKLTVRNNTGLLLCLTVCTCHRMMRSVLLGQLVRMGSAPTKHSALQVPLVKMKAVLLWPT